MTPDRAQLERECKVLCRQIALVICILGIALAVSVLPNDVFRAWAVGW